MKNYLLIVLSAAFMFIAGCKEKPVTVEIKKPMNEAFEEKRIQLLSNYTYIDPFSTDEGVARVEKDAKYGYIDSTGKEIVPVTNYNVQSFSEGLGLVEESESSFYFVDKTGKKIIDLSAYSNAFSFADGYSTVEKHDHYGLIDKTGKEVYPCTSDEGLWAISPGNYIVNNKGVKSVMNLQGQPTLPFKNFGELYYDKDNNQYAVNDQKGKWVIAAPDGTVKIKVDGEGLIYKGNGVYLLSKTTDSTGTMNALMNGKGELVVPYGKYYSISAVVSNGLICVGIKSGETPGSEAGITDINQKIGYIDVTGKEIIPLQFEDTMLDFSEGLAGVKSNGKMGFIDTTGKLVIPATFDVVKSFQNGFAEVSNGDTTHIVDKTGKIIK